MVVDDLLDTMTSFADQITLSGPDSNRSVDDTNRDFPFVTVPHFEVHARQARKKVGIEQLVYAPIIATPEQAEFWVQNYTMDQYENWMTASRTFELSKTGETWESRGFDTTAKPMPFLYGMNETTGLPQAQQRNAAPWTPVWQLSPVPISAQIINLNARSLAVLKQAEEAVTRARRGLLTRCVWLKRFSGFISTDPKHDAYHDSLVSSEESDSFDRPHLFLVQPVFGTVYDNAPVVGFVYSVITWDSYVVNLLPKGAAKMTVVVANDCEQSYSYEVDGDKVSRLF